MDHLYIIGAEQRTLRPLMADDQTWAEFYRGVVLRVNIQTGQAERVFEYRSPEAVRGEGAPVFFKSGTLEKDRLYLCTQTEVLVLALPSFNLIAYLSLPCFNDLHHVRPTSEGNLLIANSGLDMVLEVELNGTVLNAWNTIGEPPWARFLRELDYRQGISTKPHRSHPNFVFYNDDEIWATRFEQKDAINLSDPSRRIVLGANHVHDGLLHQGRVYFTAVDGKILIANPETLEVEEIVDLSQMYEGERLLGWCRAIHMDRSRAWVGFSRIRPTRFRERLSWIRLGFRHSLPTHIACYDLERKRCVQEIDVEQYGLNAIYSIFAAEEAPRPTVAPYSFNEGVQRMLSHVPAPSASL